jgi:hypothetical protein
MTILTAKMQRIAIENAKIITESIKNNLRTLLNLCFSAVKYTNQDKLNSKVQLSEIISF